MYASLYMSRFLKMERDNILCNFSKDTNRQKKKTATKISCADLCFLVGFFSRRFILFKTTFSISVDLKYIRLVNNLQKKYIE